MNEGYERRKALLFQFLQESFEFAPTFEIAIKRKAKFYPKV
jgi:hypothetical protein